MPHYLEGTSSPEDDGSYSLNSEESFNELRRLTEMGDDYDDRFRKTGDLSDANQMIECFEKALELLSDNHPAISNYLERLGRSFMHRFEHSGNLSDIETAVEYEREAISLCSSEDSDRPRFLNSLGFCLLRRFERLGNLCDIDEAIKLQLGALLGLRETDLMKPIICRSLCLSYTSRFDQLGDLADIDKAIDFQQRALSESDKDAMGLEHLGLAFMRRFVRLGDLTDINRAIECQQEAISLMTDENSLGPREFNSLGLSFMRRFEHLGNISDINQAVDALERSILLAKSGATDKPTFLNNLGMACMRRFERLGNLEDISRAIECQEKALSLSPADHALRPTFANNLAISFMRRFERLGDLPDIDNTISWLQQAVPTEPSSHALGPTFINNLGLAFMLRFGLLGDLADINEAIDRQHVAISFTPGDHAEKPRFFSNLGRSFMRRFGSLGDLGDVDDAIRCQLQAISLAPSTHSLRHAFFDNLGSCFISRFEISNDPEDVNKAIEYQQQGVLLTPTGHAQRPSHLSNLGKSMRCRYEHLRKIEDISEAIKWEEEAVILAPEEHYNKPEFLCDLGHSFSSRFWHSEDLSDFNQAIDSFQKAAKSPAGPAIVRFNAARSWAKLYAQQYQSTVLDAYELAMSLVPRIVWMGTTVRHRYQNTALIGDFVVEAAAAAIASRKYPQALEWLEEGRSIVWGQRLKLRTPVDQLRAVDAELADRLELVGKELETVSVSKPDGEKATLEEAAQRHHRLAEEWETLVKAVRKLHGFDDFLLPKRAKELMAATKQGVIIVVNIHLARCDALIMSSRSEEVIHVPLEEFTYRKAAKASSDWTRSLKICGVRDRGGFMSKSSVLVQAQFIPILAMLWVEVVKPVFDRLGYLVGTRTLVYSISILMPSILGDIFDLSASPRYLVHDGSTRFFTVARSRDLRQRSTRAESLQLRNILLYAYRFFSTRTTKTSRGFSGNFGGRTGRDTWNVVTTICGGRVEKDPKNSRQVAFGEDERF